MPAVDAQQLIARGVIPVEDQDAPQFGAHQVCRRVDNLLQQRVQIELRGHRAGDLHQAQGIFFVFSCQGFSHRHTCRA